jgi:hypothetical protein
MRTVKGTGYKANRTGSGSDAVATFCASTVVLLSFDMGGELVIVAVSSTCKVSEIRISLIK